MINDRVEAPSSLSHGWGQRSSCGAKEEAGSSDERGEGPFPPLLRSEAALRVLLACGDGEKNN